MANSPAFGGRRVDFQNDLERQVGTQGHGSSAMDSDSSQGLGV